ncbi:MAG: hypothetical protein AAB490_00610, partial [Patescibacteria group bacterium]
MTRYCHRSGFRNLVNRVQTASICTPKSTIQEDSRMAEQTNRDLVLAPGEFAYVLDTTKGIVSVLVGPFKTSPSQTDQTVLWDPATGRYKRVELDKAVQS